jgi:hypothetical protein
MTAGVRPGGTLVPPNLPDADQLKRAGAPRTAAVVEGATRLYAEAIAARGATTAARRQLDAARMRDQREAARAVADDPQAPLRPRHQPKAEKVLEDSERREAALKAAYVTAMERVDETVAEERKQLEHFAAAERDHAIEQVREIAVAARALVERLGAALSADRWANSDDRHWKIALGRRDVRPNIEVGMVLDYLDRMATVLEAERTVAEREEPAEASPTNLSQFIGI